MRNKMLIILICLSNLTCAAQDFSNTWLPEKYINAIIAKDAQAKKYLSPVEGFESIDKTFYILMFNGELSPIKFEKFVIDGKEKYKLYNLQYLVNLKYSSKELANRLSESDIYISKTEGKLLLEIIDKDKKEEIYFVDRKDGYQFKNIKETEKYFQ